MISSVSQYCPRVIAELSDLQEFYDTDTVELISWIRLGHQIKHTYESLHCGVLTSSSSCRPGLRLQRRLSLREALSCWERWSCVRAQLWPVYRCTPTSTCWGGRKTWVRLTILLKETKKNINWYICFSPCRLIRCTQWDLQRTSTRFWPLRRQTTWSSRSPYVTSSASTKAAGSKTCSTSPTDTWVHTLVLQTQAADSYLSCVL